jgi:hypothetical protein
MGGKWRKNSKFEIRNSKKIGSALATLSIFVTAFGTSASASGIRKWEFKRRDAEAQR